MVDIPVTMDTEQCDDSRFAIALKRPGPGLGCSKPDQANPGLVISEILHIDFWSRNQQELKRRKPSSVRLVFNIVFQVDYPRLILRNKLAGKSRLNPGLG